MLFLYWLLIAVCSACSGTRPANLGVTKGKFGPCPGAPHCVSSQNVDEAKRMQPFTYTTSRNEALEKILTILR